ncbi:hypothetical protein SPSYN_01116 [Sporotomaculum syntrophicum]|uniref:DUF4179 domain-containing protein n=1 Tax=Sporotomaculum syntrophicum TaxID=182264 RepID=A0A9D2WPY7_9FIRM|nr:hypothetical protein [Sporotomaculum syntrophicum]KAF1084980.1 hypothetical protein SPSYN_01116 [Sporotomaculum syntrophicum]
MNEDKIIWMLNRLDDDRAEKEIDKLMEGVDFDMESIKRKAVQKLARHNKKSRLRKCLTYAAAVCACFVCVNVVYADEISQAIKLFFNKTPVYSTMVDGKAYYLPERLKLDDQTTVDSFMVASDRMEMELTSDLSEEAIYSIKVVPKNNSGVEYTSGGNSMEGDNKYFLLLLNDKEKNYNFIPAKEYNLLLGGKTFTIALEEAKSLDGTQKLTESAPNANKIDLVTVGASSIERDGKLAVQLIASFKDQDMKLEAFGESKNKISRLTMENLGKNRLTSTGTGLKVGDIYATDEKGSNYKLEKPQDAKTMPITTFVTEAPQGTSLAVNLPALQACYQKKVDSLSINIPKNGMETLNREVDLIAQKAVVQSVERLSPTSARLTFKLNTGNQEFVKTKSFKVYNSDVKKIDSEFNGDTAIMTLEFNKQIDAADLEVSWPNFEINGNWTINLK